MKDYKLYLANPAADWENASPIGCGYMGAMVFGRIGRERLQFNEERIWCGSPEDHKSFDPDFRRKIDVLRQMLLEGKGHEADEYAEKNLSFPWLIQSADQFRYRRFAAARSSDDCHTLPRLNRKVKMFDQRIGKF